MTEAVSDGIKALRGLVCVPCTTGLITNDTHIHFANLRSWNDRAGLQVEYPPCEAKLVESARDAVCEHALKQNYDYLLMIDGDAAPFEPHALGRMLQLAFELQPSLDVLGAYCQVKGWPYLPTIDTGTGRWQPEPAYQGTLPVIRTGAHFLLVKTRILKVMGRPWFRTRQALTGLKVVQEFDNLSRQVLDGKNPLVGTNEWDRLMVRVSGRQDTPSAVGEDSGFCDRVRACGGQIAVDTDLIVGHVSRDVILPRKMIESLNEMDENRYARVGVHGYR